MTQRRETNRINQSQHLATTGTGVFVCREDHNLVGRVIAEKRRRQSIEWRNT